MGTTSISLEEVKSMAFLIDKDIFLVLVTPIAHRAYRETDERKVNIIKGYDFGFQGNLVF